MSKDLEGMTYEELEELYHELSGEIENYSPDSPTYWELKDELNEIESAMQSASDDEDEELSAETEDRGPSAADYGFGSVEDNAEDNELPPGVADIIRLIKGGPDAWRSFVKHHPYDGFFDENHEELKRLTPKQREMVSNGLDDSAYHVLCELSSALDILSAVDSEDDE